MHLPEGTKDRTQIRGKGGNVKAFCLLRGRRLGLNSILFGCQVGICGGGKPKLLFFFQTRNPFARKYGDSFPIFFLASYKFIAPEPSLLKLQYPIFSYDLSIPETLSYFCAEQVHLFFRRYFFNSRSAPSFAPEKASFGNGRSFAETRGKRYE